VVEYTQSRKRVCGQYNMSALCGHHASQLGFSIRSVLGSCDLWVTEYVISYDERPVYTGSIMEFRDGKVARETQSFAGLFDPPPWRAEWVERRE